MSYETKVKCQIYLKSDSLFFHFFMEVAQSFYNDLIPYDVKKITLIHVCPSSKRSGSNIN